MIDYLFISHLDYDHVSLVETLFSTVRNVRNIVLPLVTIEQLAIVMTYHKLCGHDFMVGFLRRIINHLRRQDRGDYFGGDYTILFVGDSEERNVGQAQFQLGKFEDAMRSFICSYEKWEDDNDKAAMAGQIADYY